MARTFNDRLRDAQGRSDSALCVGLDPRGDRLPSACGGEARPFFAFCRQVVDATAELVCAFKPQYACFAATGAFDELRTLIAYIHENHPGVPVILDAKRGDIGDVSALYAKEVFEVLDADAATVNPYLGWDAVEPFTRVPGRGAIVLCHTSNPGSPWLQEFPEAAPVYLRVAERVAKEDTGNLALVVGATFPGQLAAVRATAPDVPFLVPGIGAQSGDLEAVFANGLAADGTGLVVSASRSVIFAGEGDRWTDGVTAAATTLRDAMRRARDASFASRRDSGEAPAR
ncbi:MAG: orotidine-5'-phosphate decarboxylase [Gammaproteobacteria bacterium]|nr:orotidine-5'-phosphate decarboxylase [Gammaproteobacteria bacterium]